MRDRILIDKDMIPYTFDILLADNLYKIEVNYNSFADMIMLALYDSDGELLSSGEPIIYGEEIFKDIRTEKFPAVRIIPIDVSGGSNTVTYENLNETVFLEIYDTEDDTIPYSGQERTISDFYIQNSGFRIATWDDLNKLQNQINANKLNIQTNSEDISLLKTTVIQIQSELPIEATAEEIDAIFDEV